MGVKLHDENYRGFASDNYAGAHPEVMAALAEANGGHQVAYGDDGYTARLQEVMASHFGEQAQAFPVFNGTGANVLSLQSLLPRWGAVVCASTAHINVDENGAPERVGGIKLLPVPTSDGKLTPELIDKEAWGWGDEHRAQPLAVSITQSTELGTLYSVDEIRAIAEHAHGHGMKVHMDGARLANAAAALGTDLRTFTTDAGDLADCNAIIISPSPKGSSTCERLVSYIHAELDKVGAPHDLVQFLARPTKPLTYELMAQADFVVVTGSQKNVKAAYSSGTRPISAKTRLRSSPPAAADSAARSPRSCRQRVRRW